MSSCCCHARAIFGIQTAIGINVVDDDTAGYGRDFTLRLSDLKTTSKWTT